MTPHERKGYSPAPMLLTTRQVAEVLAVSEPTVRRLVEAGKLPRVRIGGSTRYRVEDVQRLIEGLHQEAPKGQQQTGYLPLDKRPTR